MSLGLRLWLMACAPIAAAACVDVAYDGGGGGPTTTATTTGTDAGGGPSTTATTGAGAGGAGGEGGAGPCVPTTELCNGVDDDCDGLTDQPPGLVAGNFCGCDWTFDAALGGRAYALCSAAGLSFDQAVCPGGTEKVVLQTNAEMSFLQTWLGPLLVAGQHAFIALTQTPSSPSVGAAWSWNVASGSTEGMVVPWAALQPDDADALEPTAMETGDQDCGAMWKSVVSTITLDDTSCSVGAAHVLCEDSSPQACVAGTTCLLAEGCTGTMNCALPVGSQCTPVPTAEACDGKDNDCDGAVDLNVATSSHACVCTTSTNAGRSYKHCTVAESVTEAQCGPGYRLVIIGSTAENDYVKALVGTADAYIGLYQLTSATMFGTDWYWIDGAAMTTPFWEPSVSPNDGGGAESGKQNCAVTDTAGWRDRDCDSQYPYVCEQL